MYMKLPLKFIVQHCLPVAPHLPALAEGSGRVEMNAERPIVPSAGEAARKAVWYLSLVLVADEGVTMVCLTELDLVGSCILCLMEAVKDVTLLYEEIRCSACGSGLYWVLCVHLGFWGGFFFFALWLALCEELSKSRVLQNLQ